MNEDQDLQVERLQRTDMAPAAVAVRPAPPQALIGQTPEETITRATAIATQLSDIIRKTGTAVQIGKREHVMVEGWTTLLALLHVQPEVEWTRRLERTDEIAYEARVALIHWPTGRRVGVAEAMASDQEETSWGDAEFSVRSMSQTRAVGKAARLAFSWIMVLAGYAATPVEEMGGVAAGGERTGRPGKPASEAQKKFAYSLASAKLGLRADQEIAFYLEQQKILEGAKWPDVSGPQCSAIIEALKALPDKPKNGAAQATATAAVAATPTVVPNPGVGPNRAKMLDRIRAYAATIETRDRIEILRLAEGIEFLTHPESLRAVGITHKDWHALDELTDPQLVALGQFLQARAEQKAKAVTS